MLSEIGQSFCGRDSLTLKRSKIQMKIKCNIHLNDNLNVMVCSISRLGDLLVIMRGAQCAPRATWPLL